MKKVTDCRPLFLLLLLVLLSASACDLFGSDDDALRPGEFAAEVSGDAERSVEGDASFAASGEGEARVFFLGFKSGEYELDFEEGPVDLGLFFESGRAGQPEVGAFSVERTPIGGGGDGVFQGNATLRLPIGPASVPVFFGEMTGTLEITEAGSERASDTFDLEATTQFPIGGGFDPDGGTVDISGSFIAEPAS
jgi:hypothetical protein